MMTRESLEKRYPFTWINQFGIECEAGWFPILTKLFDLFEVICIEEQISPAEITIIQIKEKFGGLRVYYSGPDKIYGRTRKAVRVAEAEASKTCEVCGVPGEGCVSNSWHKTVCKEHRTRDNSMAPYVPWRRMPDAG